MAAEECNERLGEHTRDPQHIEMGQFVQWAQIGIGNLQGGSGEKMGFGRDLLG